MSCSAAGQHTTPETTILSHPQRYPRARSKVATRRSTPWYRVVRLRHLETRFVELDNSNWITREHIPCYLTQYGGHAYGRGLPAPARQPDRTLAVSATGLVFSRPTW